MKQSRLMSLIESAINILVGFGIAVAAQAIFLPLLGVPIPLAANLGFAAIMTAISIARSYLLRRLFEALHIRNPISPFMLAVIAERRRQIEVEGWTHEHDDDHRFGEIARAGIAYVAHAAFQGEGSGESYAARNKYKEAPPNSLWPWLNKWWKPDEVRRDLVKGCALISAEGDKFDRSKRKPAVTDDASNTRSAVIDSESSLTLAHNKTRSEQGGASA